MASPYVRQWCTKEVKKNPDHAGTDDRAHNTFVQDSQPDNHQAEGHELPPFAERQRQWQRNPDDRADGCRPRTAKKGSHVRTLGQTIEPRGAREDEQERWCKRDESGECRTTDTRRSEADRGNRQHHRAGSHLTERNRIQELRVRHPMVYRYRVMLHQWNDHEAAAVGQCTDFQCNPTERAEATNRYRSRYDEERNERSQPIDSSHRDFHTTAGEQCHDDEWARSGSSQRANERVRNPTPSTLGRFPTRFRETEARIQRDRRNRSARPSADGEHPCGR